MNGLSSDIKELVRVRTDIVSLIGESLTLHSQRGGRVFKALCPFHDDHNPSMEVNPERQTYRCWSCNEGGDCFSWVMKYEGLGFREALESLARRAGVEIPQYNGPRDPQAPSGPDKQSLYAVLAWAEEEFHRFLLQAAQAERARDYLRSRNFSSETIAKYRLGYHPDHWDWLSDRARGRFSSEALQTARLIQARDNGSGNYDLFVDRVLFPIHDERGRTVAFGGRMLPDTKYNTGGKYFNSPESPVFHKSKLIFALDKARDAIRKTGTAVVMEGYVDCIKAHQSGVLNAVATLGTALTEQHVAFLKRLAERVVLVYDGDTAGVNAAARAVERFLEQDVDLRVLTLPENLDPDEFLDAHGATAFESLIQSAPAAWDVRYRYCVSHLGTGTVEARLKVLDEMLELLASMPRLQGSVKENVLVTQLAQRLGIGEADVHRRLRDVRGRTAADGARRKVTAAEATLAPELAERKAAILSLQQRPRKDDLLECELLQILLTAPQAVDGVRREIGVDDLRNAALRDLLAACYDLADHGELPDLAGVLNHLECPLLKGLVVWIDDQAVQHRVADKLTLDGTGPNALLNQVVASLQWRRSEASQQANRGRLAERIDPTAGLDPELRDLLQRAASFHQQRAAKKLPS